MLVNQPAGKIHCRCGGMAEWLKAAVLKTASRVIVTGVRIPLPPPVGKKKELVRTRFRLEVVIFHFLLDFYWELKIHSNSALWS